MKKVVLPAAYDAMMAGKCGLGKLKDMEGQQIRTFLLARLACAVLAVVLHHLISINAWGPDSPAKIEDLDEQVHKMPCNENPLFDEGATKITSEVLIALRLKTDSFAVCPLRVDPGRVFLIEVGHDCTIFNYINVSKATLTAFLPPNSQWQNLQAQQGPDGWALQ